MKLIKLGNRGYVKVDDADYRRLSQYGWTQTTNGYAIRTQGPRTWGGKRVIFMHRELLNLPRQAGQSGVHVDHINGDKLDNQRSNLRLCNKQGNSANRNPAANNTSGYKGVTWCQGKWVASLKHNQRYVYLGRHATREEAALAYNNGAAQYFGEFVKLNTIPASGSYGSSWGDMPHPL